MVTVLSPVLIQNELRFLLQLCHHQDFTAVLTSQLCRQPELPDQQREVNVNMQFLEVPKRLRPAWNATAQGAPNSPTCKLSTSTARWRGWTLASCCILCGAPHIYKRFTLQKPAALSALHLHSMPCFGEHHTGLFTSLCLSAGSIPIGGEWASAWVASCSEVPATQWLKAGSAEDSDKARFRLWKSVTQAKNFSRLKIVKQIIGCVTITLDWDCACSWLQWAMV